MSRFSPRTDGLLTSILTSVFGEDTYCDHGMKASDGVCPDCVDALYPPDEDAEVIYLPYT